VLIALGPERDAGALRALANMRQSPEKVNGTIRIGAEGETGNVRVTG